MQKKDIIIGIFIPILCAVIGVIGGAVYTSRQSVQQNSDISVHINNILNADSGNAVSQSVDLKASTDNLIDAYETTKAQSNQQARELETLQSQYEQLQEKYQQAESNNQTLSEENEKLKAFLLQDNRYADSIDDLVVVKTTKKHLSDLFVVDSSNYEQVEAVTDYYGNVHSVSYLLRSYNVAQVLYRLDGKYDTFNANIATTKDTGANLKISVEIYVDDELRWRRDNIQRSLELIPLDTIVLHGAETMKIKTITTEGEGYYGYVYITDDSLGVVQ